MRVLVLWRKATLSIRATIEDHVYSFQKYDPNNEYFYFNIYNGRFSDSYEWIKPGMFDAVIFHYSALSLRYTLSKTEKYWMNYFNLMVNVFKDYLCIKIFLMQDDYSFTQEIWKLARAIKTDCIYTIIREEDYSVVYPSHEIGNSKVKTVYTGYIEDKYIKMFSNVPCESREWDIVYRARKLPYSFGRLGQVKYELVKIFSEKSHDFPELRFNLQNTQEDKGAFLGLDWMKFLASSRCCIGCLGGRQFYGRKRKNCERCESVYDRKSRCAI